MKHFQCGHEITLANIDNHSQGCRACRIERQEKYSKTDKGRARHSRYNRSLKGRIRVNLCKSRKRLGEPIHA